MMFTILHISDFHFSKRRYREQGIVVDALVDDLANLCIGHRKPDLVMFTGDLVHAAGIDRHDEAYDFLIDRVSKATGCSDERIFIAAGNHDLSWAGLERFALETNEWRSLLGKQDEMDILNELHVARAFDASVEEKFANYLDLERYLSHGDRSSDRRLANSFVTVDHVAALNTDIVTFNTAVLSTGGHKSFSGDERQLIMPEYAVMEAVRQLSPGSLRIFVTHHPLNWLTEQCSKYLDGQIAEHAHIHLFGHMHDPQPKRIVGLKGEVLSDQAGAIFTSRKDYYNGYALITFDRSTKYAETLVRSYYKDRNEFDHGTDVIRDGKWWSSTEAQQHFRKIAEPIDAAKFRRHLAEDALKHLLERERAIGGEGDQHERFVAPPLKRTFIQESSDDTGKIESETPVSFTDVVVGDDNLILYARAEYGRTTLLREIRYRLLALDLQPRYLRLPILIDFADIGSNTDNMLRKLRAGAELLPEGSSVESLLRLGHACVLIDDVQFADTRRMRILRSFVELYPKVRYILSSPQWSATKFGACIDPEMPARFEFVEVCEFRRNDMRQLLARDERCTDVEEWLDRLQDEFREINLPFTAANGSILIEILAERYNFTPINRAVLMEQFVDSTLRKAAVEQSRRETFDYTNKTDLLSHVAAWMARGDDYVPTKERLRAEFKAYVDTRGLNPDIDDLLTEFLAARILISKSDDRISFRYRGVLEYFIALRMTADPEFKDWVMAEERYLSYVNEIQFYAGKLRSDAALVSLVAGRHETILDDALSEIGDLDLAQLEQTTLPSEKDGEGVEALAYEIARPPLTQDEKDAELEADIPTDAEDRQEVFRPKSRQPSDRVTLSLILYSGLVKNMELIPDADKRRHLSAIWRGWGILLVAALRFAPRLAKERKVRINGALYEVQAPHGMNDATLLRQMMLLLPHVHLRMLANALGTEKLERQLTEPTLAEHGEPMIYDFFRVGLIADLRLSAMPAAVRTLMGKMRDNRYLLWSMIVHLSQLRRLDRIKGDHFKALEAPLAGALADIRGGSEKARSAERQKQMKRLERERLVLKIKPNRDS